MQHPANHDAMMIGASAAMEKLNRLVRKLAARRSTVLIQGESGTGKELVARAIHEISAEAQQAFVAVDCAALPATLVESELFGHVAGAFTGAHRAKPGLFQAAHGGTLFLDEVGELSLEIQAKLLRALQQREVRPVGSVRPEKVDVRVLAATNRDLKEEVKKGAFRDDLYFRLAVVTVRVPSLRERKEDIPLLAGHFAKRSAPGGYDARITPEAMRALTEYDWPGNVRELENAIERAVALNTNGPIRREDLPTSVLSAPMAAAAVVNGGSMMAMERQAIVEALVKAKDNRLEAAKILGIGKTTLYRKIKDYGISN